MEATTAAMHARTCLSFDLFGGCMLAACALQWGRSLAFPCFIRSLFTCGIYEERVTLEYFIQICCVFVDWTGIDDKQRSFTGCLPSKYYN
jgi:hypothetical protein